MNLFIDIGNSYVKINFQKNKYLFFLNKKKNSVKIWYELFAQKIQHQKEIKNIFISSVVMKTQKIIIKVLKKYFNLIPHILNHDSYKELKLEVENPKEVGADLIALSAFLISKTQNGIMINLGSATTIIHVIDKKLKGVIIMPGIKMQLECLIKNISNFSKIKIQYINKNLGQNTKEAVSLGILQAHIEAIKNFIKNLDPKAKIYFSGGNAKILKIYKFVNYNYAKEATIKGLKFIFQKEK